MVNLSILSGETSSPTTPDNLDAHENGSGVQPIGGPIKSPRPSNKERLARSWSRGIVLFDIAGLASTHYHGGMDGVSELTVAFIHNCDYQSFSNTVSP